jgi:hypothetical protein
LAREFLWISGTKEGTHSSPARGANFRVFFITRARKEKLLEMGFEDREMKPEDAHRHLGSEDFKPK